MREENKERFIQSSACDFKAAFRAGVPSPRSVANFERAAFIDHHHTSNLTYSRTLAQAIHIMPKPSRAKCQVCNETESKYTCSVCSIV